MSLHRPLRCGRRSQRGLRAREGVVEAVAVVLHLGAAALTEGGAEQPVMIGEQAGVAIAEFLQQSCGALDVGEEEGDRAGWESHRQSSLMGGGSAGRKAFLVMRLGGAPILERLIGKVVLRRQEDHLVAEIGGNLPGLLSLETYWVDSFGSKPSWPSERRG